MEKIILLVDDDEEMRFMLSYILVKNGYIVHEASNGLHGLRVFERLVNFIDLVITDFDMPIMNGAEMLKAIHAINPSLPSIVVSAHKYLDFSYNGIDKNKTDLLEKPINRSLFEKLVAESLFKKPVFTRF